jgi:hypothetical protein
MSLKASRRADKMSQISHERTLAYRVHGSSTGRQAGCLAQNRAGTTGKMAKFVLMAVAAVVVIVVGGATFLMVWDVPAPTTRVEHAIPDSKLPK